MLAVAAKHHSVPLMVCTGLYKLSPLYPYDQDTFNDFISPGSVIRYNKRKNKRKSEDEDFNGY